MTVSICLIDIVFFFFNDTATTEIYTLSLHDALPIRHSGVTFPRTRSTRMVIKSESKRRRPRRPDRKSTRLNSSHMSISYAVFCLKKKTTYNICYLHYRKKKNITY